MTLPHEKHIRDLLADDLDLLEPGLRLVGTEHHLPNSHGTRGFVDILARDRHGMWVVVEIKRTNATGREALHEVAKYTELLRAEKHLRPDRIRSIIVVSREWDELLAPVSNIARDWAHDLRGYQLFLNPDGTLSRAEPIEFLPAPFEHRPSPIHFMYFYNTPADRDRGWQQVLRYAEEAGARDLVAADLDHVGPPEAVMAPYCLYFAIGTLDPALVVASDKDSELDDEEEEEEEEPSARGHPAEYRVLCHITAHVFAVTCETGNPDRFADLNRNPDWRRSAVRRAGSYAHGDVRTDEDIAKGMSGNEGGAQFTFTGSANPKIESRWTTFVSEVTDSLAGNKDWTTLLRFWFDEISRHPTDSDVVAHIYNPCDLIQTLVYGLPSDLHKYAPDAYVAALRRDAPNLGVRGGLFWDGATIPDLLDRVRLVYRDPFAYMAYRYGGDTWRADQDLLELLGLRYVLIEAESAALPSADDVTNLLMVCDGQPRRFSPPFTELRTEGLGRYPLSTFIEHHVNEIAHLVDEYRHIGMGISL